MPHAARARGSPPLGLLAPFEAARLGAGVAARGTRGLLLVEGHLAATSAGGVRLGVALTEALRTFRLDDLNR